MGEIKICAACKKRISPREFQEGLVGERNGKPICQECAGPRKPQRDEMVAMLERILKEVKSINQTLAFEDASIWNILGAVVQCFVIAALMFAYLKGGRWDADTMLSLAILFQMMALTFFMLKK